jgi:hypothetical protein
MRYSLSIILTSLLALGCGKKNNEVTGSSGQARVGFSNATALTLADNATYYAPTMFGVKLAGISLSTDADTTQGSGSAIWVHPDCTKVELEDSKTEGETVTKYKYIGMGTCLLSTMKSYLDLARSSDLVNADLNSQHLPILPNKTYNYAHITICSGAADADPGANLKFQSSGMSAASEVRTGTCGFTTAKFATPVAVTESTKIKVTLKYDLAKSIYDYGAGMSQAAYCYFNSDSSVRRCAQIPTLSAEVTAE